MTSTHTHNTHTHTCIHIHTHTHTIHIHYLCECIHAFTHSQANVVLYCVSLTTYSSINLSPYRWYKIISRNVSIYSWLLNKPSNLYSIITICIVKWRHILNTSNFVIFILGKFFFFQKLFHLKNHIVWLLVTQIKFHFGRPEFCYLRNSFLWRLARVVCVT